MEEKKNLPHRIIGMIFEEHPEGISMGELKKILDESLRIAESIQIVVKD